MRIEALEAPLVVQRLIEESSNSMYLDCVPLFKSKETLLIGIGRGSSGFACDYVLTLASISFGLMSMRAELSLINRYRTRWNIPSTVLMVFSQSGKSPDLLEAVHHLQSCGATAIALLNNNDSPLAALVDHPFNIEAGLEGSVAATKSVLAQMCQGLLIVLAVQNASCDSSSFESLTELLSHQVLRTLPDTLRKACSRADSVYAQAWIESIIGCGFVLLLTRGLAMPAAQEISLKLQEVCQIQSHAMSVAQWRHGPQAAVLEGNLVIVIKTRSSFEQELEQAIHDLNERGAKVLVVVMGESPLPQSTDYSTLVLDAPMHPWLDSIVVLQCFYLLIEHLAKRLRLDPDKPPWLSKVTLTN